jgi:cytochrome c oxidase cbb3-type subunit 3
MQRGMRYFLSFNCVGCHAPNGGGGMGPALSNRAFVYGSDPANVYLSISQGRPNGMPAWGAALPDGVIWDLVSYIGSISKEAESGWGKTFSTETMSKEQVPVEYLQTTSPWDHTQSFSSGQKPERPR